jgi:DNA-binding response OmpR family regulator
MAYPHILLVDDEHIVLDALENMLSDSGFRTSRAATSGAALEIFARNDIDLLITDIKMPGSLDGVALAGLMREKKSQLPVIFLSGNLDGLANSARLASPSAFLVKPVDLTDTLGIIDMLMTGRYDPTDVIDNRAASVDRQLTERPIGTPDSDRHAAETAYTWEDEEKPVHKPGSSPPQD